LENIVVRPKPFTVHIDINSSGVLGEPMFYKIAIVNSTGQLHKLELTTQENEAFLFSGPVKYTIEILPRSTKHLEYIMVPVVLGKQKAPNCVIKCQTLDNEVILDNEEARIIYVYPTKEN